MAGARRFELVEGTSAKFWEIAVAGSSHTVRYGRIGSDGVGKTKAFANAAAAQPDAAKLIAEKLRKGYGEGAAKPGGKTQGKPAKTAKTAKTVKTAKPAKSAKPGGGKIGPYLQALLDEIATGRRRKKPDRGLAALAAAAEAADVGAFFDVLAKHEPGHLVVGDYYPEGVNGSVPAPDTGGDEERSDVTVIGTTGGGDLFVVLTPGTAGSAKAASRVYRIVHDNDWSQYPVADGLDAFIESLAADGRRNDYTVTIDSRLGKRTPKERWIR